MKALVTGASGFIGGHLLRSLRDAGFQVRAAGRRRSSLDGIEWVDLPDVTRADWPLVTAGMDVVIHLAAIAHARGVDAQALKAVNCDAAVALARALSPEQHLVFVSSIRAATGPSAPGEIREDSAPHPVCAYGRAKRAAEEIILQLKPTASVLRPVTVYGAGAKHNMRRLASLARSALPLPFGSLAAPRSYVSIENVCAAVAFAAQGRRSGVFTVSDPDTASVRELVAWYREAIGAPRRLFGLPRVATGALARNSALRDVLTILTEPLVARPSRLLSTGWSPVHASTRAGVRDWALRSETSLA